MKKTFVAIALVFASCFVNAQQPSDYESITLKVKEDYTPEVDKTALGAADYLLTTPIEKDNVPRLKAAQFLIRWMTGSPTYTFTISEPANKISKGNDQMMITYLAAMSKYALENPKESKDDKKVKLNATKMVLDYCKKYDIKMNGELKKLNQANEKGELEKYLGV